MFRVIFILVMIEMYAKSTRDVTCSERSSQLHFIAHERNDITRIQCWFVSFWMLELIWVTASKCLGVWSFLFLTVAAMFLCVDFFFGPGCLLNLCCPWRLGQALYCDVCQVVGWRVLVSDLYPAFQYCFRVLPTLCQRHKTTCYIRNFVRTWS